MNLKTIACVLGVSFLVASCNKYKQQVTENGLKYLLHEHDDAARKAKLGEILTFHLVLKNGSDSVLRDTYKEAMPVRLVLQQPPFKASFEEGLALLAKGDSATFYVNADSLFAKMMAPMPPSVKKGTDLSFTVKVLDVQTSEEFQKAQAEAGSKQKGIDEKIIADYVAKNKLQGVQKTASGLNYIDEVVGTGDSPGRGDNVKVHYAGKLLDGKEFDNSRSNPQSGGKPIDFQVGVGMVIPGWEEGIMSMKKGGKRKLIIPSGLAYGVDGSPGAIPPNSVLVFDVELVDFSKGSTKPTP